MTVEVEAIELYNFIQNEADLYCLQVSAYKKHERLKNVNRYVNHYLEADVIYIVNIAARRYVKHYCKYSVIDEVFPWLVIRATAMHIANTFDIEINCGNSWL